jgi:hypothetical protein
MINTVNNAAISAISLNATRFNKSADKLQEVKVFKQPAATPATPATPPDPQGRSESLPLLRQLSQQVRQLNAISKTENVAGRNESARPVLTEFKKGLQALTQAIQKNATENPELAQELQSLKNRLISRARDALDNFKDVGGGNGEQETSVADIADASAVTGVKEATESVVGRVDIKA